MITATERRSTAFCLFDIRITVSFKLLCFSMGVIRNATECARFIRPVKPISLHGLCAKLHNCPVRMAWTQSVARQDGLALQNAGKRRILKERSEDATL
jgi:hypothetical protein